MIRYIATGFAAGTALLVLVPGTFTVSAPATAEPAPHVMVQAGHQKQERVPAELDNLRHRERRVFGATTTESNITTAVANKVARRLRENGIRAETVPATVPPAADPDASISVHADWSSDTRVRGYKFAGSAFDRSGQSSLLARRLRHSYETAVPLPWHDYITHAMRRYYAFNWREFDHSITPGTPGAIIELGFLSNAADRRFLLKKQHVVSRAIANGIIRFLND